MADSRYSPFAHNAAEGSGTLWLLYTRNLDVDTGCCSDISYKTVFTLCMHLGHY